MLVADHFITQLSDLEPTLILAIVLNSLQCIALVAMLVLLVRYHHVQRKQVEALQTLLLRGLQPEDLIKLKRTLDLLSEADLEDLLDSRGGPPGGPPGGSSTGSSR